MNRFRRAAAFIIIAELLIIGVMNWIYLSWEKRQGRFYRVEAERIDMFLEESDALRAAPEDIDLSQFDSIIRVSEYDPSETVNNDYLVEEAGGKLFRIEYKVEDSSRAYIFMNIGMAAGLLVTVLVLIYIGRKVIRPFDDRPYRGIGKGKSLHTDQTGEEPFLWPLYLGNGHAP